MSVIIRLQNLPWTANALDIRRFFTGLSIPDGGVHIVGGEKGDAFIAFSTDEDARRAMMMDGSRLGGNVIKLLLSSKTEMQNVIAVARGVPSQVPSTPQVPQQTGYGAQVPPTQPGPQHRYGPPVNQQQNQGQYGQNIAGPPGPNIGGPPEQRNMPPQFNAQPQGMVPMNQQARPGERWDGGPHASQGNNQMREPPVDYGRRDLPPNEINSGRDMPQQVMMNQPYDRGMQQRDMGPNQGYHRDNVGPVNGSHQIMERPQMPANDYRDAPREYREDYGFRNERGRSPGRDRNQYDERHFDNRRDAGGRKRGFEMASPFVYISRMPLDVNYRDVRRFFTGLEIPRDGLKMINDRKGRRVGDAYVRFMSEEVAQKALSMDGWRMGDCQVRIEPVSREEFDRSIDSYVPGHSPDREMHPDRSHNPHMGMQEPSMKRMRSRSPSEVRKGDSKCVVIKNLPFKVEKRDIFKFFSGLRFAKGDTSVHIEEGNDGRPKGIALIEFAADKDVIRALSYHRKGTLGGRPIDVISIPTEEYHTRSEKYLQRIQPKDDKIERDRSLSKKRDDEKGEQEETSDEKNAASKEGEGKLDDSKDESNKDAKDEDASKRFYCVELRGVPYSTNVSTLRSFFKGLEIAHRGIHIVYQPDGTASGSAFVEFVSSDACKKALEKDKEYIGKRYVTITPITKKAMLEEMRKQQNHFGPPNRGQPPMTRGQQQPSIVDKVGRPGCVVGVQNLHFNTTLEDILDFFRGFHPIAESVKMRYNQDGRPTGDAMVPFHNREDADLAVRELNRRRLHQRPLSLCIV